MYVGFFFALKQEGLPGYFSVSCSGSFNVPFLQKQPCMGGQVHRWMDLPCQSEVPCISGPP